MSTITARLPRLLRLPRTAMTALLWATVIAAATLAPSPARAAFIVFSGDPAPAGSLTFFANGGLSGIVPITMMGPPSPTPGLPSFAVNGVLIFNLGRVGGTDANGDFFYGHGGSVSVSGSFNGGPFETILDCDREMTGGVLLHHADGRYGFDFNKFGTLNFVAPDVISTYGTSFVGLGTFSVDFVGTPGEVVGAGAIVTTTYDISPGLLPEPASAGMLGVGGVLAGLAGAVGHGRRRRGRAAG